MAISVFDTVSGSTFIFPMLPESIRFSAATKFIEYELIQQGDVVVPLGEELSQIEWDGVLPGENKKNLPYVSNWKNPREIQEIWSVWRNKGRKLRITIDDTPINHGVYLKSYDIDYSGGFGDYSYKISFIAAKEIEIKIEPKPEVTEKEEEETVQEQQKQYVKVTGGSVWVRAKGSTSGKKIFVAHKGEEYEYAGKKSGNWYYIIAKGSKRWISSRYSKLVTKAVKVPVSSSASTSSSQTYTVKSGDTLWTIAQKYYGDGSKYDKIKSANNLKSNDIQVGQKLIIP